ncbi:MAG TPA: hypothetical protein VM639_04440 [Dongiaceae bacterium]|nr:hypothetical protein [Dongiaceae bacterium]
MLDWRHIVSSLVLAALLAGATPSMADDDASAIPPAAKPEAAKPEATPVPKQFSGAWFVTGAFPAASAQGSVADPHIGTVIVLKAAEASDVNGRRCFSPRFNREQVKGDALGIKGVSGMLEQLQVSCAGQPFATLLLLPGKSLQPAQRQQGNASLGDAPVLMVRRPEALYLLERGEQVAYRQATIATNGVPAAAAPAHKPASKAAPRPSAPKAKPQAGKPIAARKPAAASTVSSKTAPKPAKLAVAEAKRADKPSAKAPAKTAAAAQKAAIPATQLLASDVSGLKPNKPKTNAIAAKPAVKPAVKPVAQSTEKPAGAASVQATPAAVKSAPTLPVATNPKAGTAIQLASYSGIDAAAEGWKALHGTYPELTALKPLYVAAGNEPTVRLFATGVAPEKLRQICGDLQSKQAYCTLSQ